MKKKPEKKRKLFEDKAWACVPRDPQQGRKPWFYDTRYQARHSGMNIDYWRVARVIVREIK